jgi:hypothetical protein
LSERNPIAPRCIHVRPQDMLGWRPRMFRSRRSSCRRTQARRRDQEQNRRCLYLPRQQNQGDPALAADCLAEGKKWIDKKAADASREQDPVLFRNGSWAFERKYAIRCVVDGHYVSIARPGYMDTGGARPKGDDDGTQ